MEFQDSDADEAWLIFNFVIFSNNIITFRIYSLKDLFGIKAFLEQKISLNIWTLKEVSVLKSL